MAVTHAQTTAFTHSLTPFAALAPPANEEISSILQCRLFRDSANALDTYTGSVALPLYGRIEALAQIPPVGLYADLLKVTLTW